MLIFFIPRWTIPYSRRSQTVKGLPLPEVMQRRPPPPLRRPPPRRPPPPPSRRPPPRPMAVPFTAPTNNHGYQPAGHPSGIRFLLNVRQMISQQNLPFRCDAPTEALGNCFPYAVMQQLHRPEVWTSLTEEMKTVSQNCHLLRQSIVQFVKNIFPTSQYFQLINDSRDNYIMGLYATTDNEPDWPARLEKMSRDGQWFDAQFMKLCAYYLRHDIICYIRTGPIKFCGSPSHDCNCSNQPLYMANINNTPYQSLLPIARPLAGSDRPPSTSQHSSKKDTENSYQCDYCVYSTPKPSNLKRHVDVKHPKESNKSKRPADVDTNLPRPKCNNCKFLN